MNRTMQNLKLDNLAIATSVQLMTDADLARFLSEQWITLSCFVEEQSAQKKAFLLRAQAFKARARELETGILQEVL